MEENIKELEVNEETLYSEDDVLNIIDELTPRVEMDLDNIKEIVLDTEEYKKGIKNGSYMAGQFVALMGVGFTKDQAYNIVLNESTCRSNLEQSKNQQVLAMQNQI